MIAVLDTSSLLALARYYLPFDRKEVVIRYFESKLQTGEFLIIDKVFEECRYISSGFILEKLPFLNDKTFLKKAKLPVKTNDLLAPSPAVFLRKVENQFTIKNVRRMQGISDVEFENRKNNFLNGADAKQIVLCLNLLSKTDELFLVSEETAHGNDNKLFKKIPAICKELHITTLTLPELLNKAAGIEIEFLSN